MASILRKLFGLRRKRVTKKDSITGRSSSFPVPYLSKLEGNQLHPGQSLIVRGLVIGDRDFLIKLTGGSKVEPDDEGGQLADRLLCCRVELGDRRKIHLNACVNGEWGKEGIVKHRWRSGDEFDVRIRCHEEEFEIFVDHKMLCRFAHYVPLSKITHIYINGDIELYTVSWEGRTYTVPYAADIPGNFYPGRKLYVSGLAKKKAKQFALEMHAGGTNVAMKLNPRFPSKKIMCNTKSNDNWTQQARLAGGESDEFPFKRNRTFDLLIYCEDRRFVVSCEIGGQHFRRNKAAPIFQVYVNDCLMGTYEHQVDPRTIDKLSIDGDIVLHGVHLK